MLCLIKWNENKNDIVIPFHRFFKWPKGALGKKLQVPTFNE